MPAGETTHSRCPPPQLSSFLVSDWYGMRKVKGCVGQHLFVLMNHMLRQFRISIESEDECFHDLGEMWLPNAKPNPTCSIAVPAFFVM